MHELAFILEAAPIRIHTTREYGEIKREREREGRSKKKRGDAQVHGSESEVKNTRSPEKVRWNARRAFSATSYEKVTFTLRLAGMHTEKVRILLFCYARRSRAPLASTLFEQHVIIYGYTRVRFILAVSIGPI